MKSITCWIWRPSWLKTGAWNILLNTNIIAGTFWDMVHIVDTHCTCQPVKRKPLVFYLKLKSKRKFKPFFFPFWNTMDEGSYSQLWIWWILMVLHHYQQLLKQGWRFRVYVCFPFFINWAQYSLKNKWFFVLVPHNENYFMFKNYKDSDIHVLVVIATLFKNCVDLI